MSDWINDRMPLIEDGVTIQYIGGITSGSDDPRDGVGQFKIVDPGMVDYRVRCWMTIIEPTDNPPPLIVFKND